MKLDHIPFVTTDWQHVAREPKPAQAGQAFWRTQQFRPGAGAHGRIHTGLRVRPLVQQGPCAAAPSGGAADRTADGRRFTLTPGMSYQAADHAEPHRSSAPGGATLFIVD